MEALDSARAKLDRAHEHLKALNGEVTAFFDSRPYGVTSKTEMHQGTDVFRVKIPDDEVLRFLRFSILIGDYVNTLRASLDHLAWGLSRLTTETPFPKTEFPIFLKPNPASVRKKIPDVPKAAQDEIEKLQPYHCANSKDILNHPLAVLYTLTNIDKHRHISVVRYAFQWTLDAPQGVHIRLIQALDDDEHIVRGTVSAPHSRATLKLDSVLLQVLIEEATSADPLDPTQIMTPPGISAGQIGTLYEFVRDNVFPRLSGFLQQGAQAGQIRPRRWAVLIQERPKK